MQIEYDPAKREDALRRRRLDMADAVVVLTGPCVTVIDERFDYGEQRFITVGLLRGRMVVVAWTPRNEKHRIVSMRKANDREITRFGPELRSPFC